MTLRQALDLLERDGLIARRHGLGTFVARPAIDYDILQPARSPETSALGRTWPPGSSGASSRPPTGAWPRRWGWRSTRRCSCSSGSGSWTASR